MDTQTKAEIDHDVARFTARMSAICQQNYSSLETETAACVFAHAAFSVLDYTIAEQMAYIRSRNILIKYNRGDTWFSVSLGLNQVVYQMRLDESVARITYYKRPYPGADEEVCKALVWPSEIVPMDQIQESARAFVKDMRAFVLHGKVPG